jgi:hypothetical protein
MSVDVALEALAAALAGATGQPVRIGPPDAKGQGLVIFPWRLANLEAIRNRLPDPSQRPKPPAEPAFQVECLVLADGDPALLGRARSALWRTPFLGEAGNVRCRLSDLAADQLAAVFSAANIPLRLCCCCTLTAIDDG